MTIFSADGDPVADRGARLGLEQARSPARTPSRFDVGVMSGSGSELNATSPTLNCFGSRSRNVRIAATAASRRVGSTSFARIEPETSTSSTIVAFWSGCESLSARMGERARGEDEREHEQQQRHDQPLPGATAGRDDARRAHRGS